MYSLNEIIKRGWGEHIIVYWIEWNTEVRLTELVWFIVQNKIVCGLCVGVIVYIYIYILYILPIYIFTAIIILYTCVEFCIIFKCKRLKPISFNLK